MEAIDALKSGYVAINEWIGKILEDVSEDDSVQRGKDKVNHIKWQVGHLCLSASGLVKALGGDGEFEGRERYTKVFDYGAELNDDPSVYPPMNEVKANFDLMNSRVVEAMDGFSAADLDGVVKFSDDWKDSRGKMIMFLTLHHAYHGGQIGAVRTKVLARKGVFG